MAADQPRGTGRPVDGLREDAVAFVMGAQVLAGDGACGTLKGAVIDPVADALTHLVVESQSRRGLGHLVPVDLIESLGRP